MIFTLLHLLCLAGINVECALGMFLGGSGGKNIASSNYLTVSRTALKNGDVTTLTPQGWLNRALKGVNTGTYARTLSVTSWWWWWRISIALIPVLHCSTLLCFLSCIVPYHVQDIQVAVTAKAIRLIEWIVSKGKEVRGRRWRYRQAVPVSMITGAAVFPLYSTVWAAHAHE